MSDLASEFQARFTDHDKAFGGIRHPVWSGGVGPPIILMHELDGFVPAFMRLALRMSEQFKVYAPVFYGRVGQVFDGLSGGVRAYFCMRREFQVFRRGRTSRIAGWVRDLAADVHHQADSVKGVGVVGMCMTGGIVLATISHACVAAGVAAQPSLPLAMIGSRRRKADLGMYKDDIQDANDSETPVLVLRYGGDWICPDGRVPSIRNQIGPACFPPNPLQQKLEAIAGHSTLTDRYRDNRDSDVQAVSEEAIDYTVSFLLEQLQESADNG